jgi:hypothetical protein
MGVNFVDQYSLLHLATGIIAYFFGLKIHNWFFLHLSFEIAENSLLGMKIINTYFKHIWPGGKYAKDTFVNSILGDNFFAILGWVLAYVFDNYGSQYGLYQKHI